MGKLAQISAGDIIGDMIPNIFIASTIEDLHHLRDAVRDTILDLAYTPVMSEYGDIGYLPSASAEDSCYTTMRQCQLAIIIIGKRYGNLSTNGVSVTENEFRTARDHELPVVCLVDQEVASYKRIFEANTGVINVPGMDAPERTFSFLQTVTASRVNNAVLTFTNVSTARQHLKSQLAHFFGDLLMKQTDPMKADVKDILSEIKTLRHEFKGEGDKDAASFMKAVRFLVDDSNKAYRDIVEHVAGSIESAVPTLTASSTFTEFVEKFTGSPPDVRDVATFAQAAEFITEQHEFFRYYNWGGNHQNPDEPTGFVIGVRKDNRRVVLNRRSLETMEFFHRAMLDVSLNNP
ncbi:MAG TPA: DUF4062 domain-containing protein [Blastocatellia bacterium]|nr:DUF4062 domain-containing protein [Blastocatellia bacterium]